MSGRDAHAEALSVALIGASGWVGSAVHRELLRRGHRVVAISRRRPRCLPPTSSWHGLDQRPRTSDLAAVLYGCEVVVNAAGAAHLPERGTRREIDEARFANEQLPALVGEAAARVGCARFVHLSSIKAVGEGGSTPLRAADAPNPSTAYGQSKLSGELSIATALAGRAVGLTIIRPPMVYGVNAPGNFARLVRLVTLGMPVPLPKPYPRRSLVYLENLASLIAHLAGSSEVSGVVHVSDPPHLTTRQLVREMADAVGAPGKVVPLPLALVTQLARFTGRRQDIDRLSRDLIVEPSTADELGGWSAPHPGHAGLRRTLAS